MEIDDRITDLAYAYFDMSDEVQVTTYDGRAYLQAVDSTYDVIQVDAYQDITIPFQMSSTEFFTLVREHLNPGGVMVVNLNMHSDGRGASTRPCVTPSPASSPMSAPWTSPAPPTGSSSPPWTGTPSSG